MQYLDFHADTLTEITEGNIIYNKNDVDLTRIDAFCKTYVQVFAIWKDRAKIKVPEKEFMELYNRAKQLLAKAKDRISVCKTGTEMENALAEGKHAAFLSIEDISIMGDYVEHCRELGFSFAMPVWNYENEYAYGAAANQQGGLKPLGKRVLLQLEEQGIHFDVSHLSDRGIEDLLMLTDAPIIASHSNVREICNHPRNLRKDHIQEIISRGGIIGMNLYRSFLGSGEKVSVTELFRHMDYILELGGENSLCMGCDFDGCGGVFPEGVTGAESIPFIRELMSRHGYGNDLQEKILFMNGFRFIKEKL